MREEKKLFKKQSNNLNIKGIRLKKRFIHIDGYQHLITECGDSEASQENTIVMMGGIPCDPSESLYWMTAELCRLDKDLHVLILHLPYYEEHSKIDLDKNLYA